MIKKTFIALTCILLIASIWYMLAPQLGAQTNKNEMSKIQTSANYKKGRFVNQEITPVMREDSSSFKVMMQFMKKRENGSPEFAIPTKAFNKTEFLNSSSGISLVWFGHSTVLMNIDGIIVLTDPFFGERASPISFAGTKKFDYSNEYNVSDLPDIDIVLISHDHYDHLDYKTIKELKKKTKKFMVPLGVAAHLEKWKVDNSKIIELDWWDNYSPDSTKCFTASPARHFSGRTLKRNTTLWCSFVIEINEHKVYFSGDSGYGKHFKEIGEKFGPFDLTLMECGQYNENWPLIHMMPNETAIANQDLQGKYMLPLHWGTFNLSLHSWTDPIDKLLEHSAKNNGMVLTPMIGETIKPGNGNQNKYWWEKMQTKL